METYFAILETDGDGNYGVTFPDLLGCVSAGDSLEAAIDNAGEALGLHLEGFTEAGEALPPASDLEAILADPENRAGSVAFMPVVARHASAPVRVNISIDSRLLAESDRVAKAEGITRSAHIAAALSARNRLIVGAGARITRPGPASRRAAKA